MKHILKKSLKVSFASVVAIKAGDIYYQQFNNTPLSHLYNPAEALYEDKSEDLLANILRTEFTGDLSDLKYDYKAKFDFVLKSRDQHLKEMQDEKSQYDILIIGGGASGAGVALEAASRGLKCAVIEKYDFASGTSSRSTKMAHGGIRYFEQMMRLQGDPFENYKLLKETLHERNYFLYAAPWQNKQLSLVIPSPSAFWTALFYFPGTFFYHMIYLRELLKSSYESAVKGPKILGRGQVVAMFENLKAIHGQYGVQMHEMQMMDTRMNLNVLLTSTIDKFVPGQKGSNIANYTEFVDFIKSPEGKIEGAIVYDKLKKKEFKIQSKVVVNCTGIHADELRMKDNPQAQKRLLGARGTHLMFSKGLLPDHTGIIIPQTSDGRLIFIINYLDHAMVGTTDEKCDITHTVSPPEKDIEFIINEMKAIFGEDFDYQKNMISAWSGIRPLVIETEEDRKQAEAEKFRKYSTIRNYIGKFIRGGVVFAGRLIHGAPKSSTAALSRNHVIEQSESGLVSLMGGKWTSFRKMGEETLDLILKSQGKNMEPVYEKSVTTKFKLMGSYSRVQITDGISIPDDQLRQQYEDHFVFEYDVPRACARSLFYSYGTNSARVVKVGKENKLNVRLHPDYDFLKSEVLYATRFELAEKPNDILCRRMPIAILNRKVAEEVLKEVVEIMGKEKKWTPAQKKQEIEEALANLEYMK